MSLCDSSETPADLGHRQRPTRPPGGDGNVIKTTQPATEAGGRIHSRRKNGVILMERSRERRFSAHESMHAFALGRKDAFCVSRMMLTCAPSLSESTERLLHNSARLRAPLPEGVNTPPLNER